jgi:hypothetical protein
MGLSAELKVLGEEAAVAYQANSDKELMITVTSLGLQKYWFCKILRLRNRLGLGKGRVVMAGGWDGDALARSMEDALERQQEAAEARRAQKNRTSPEEREHKAREESVRLSRAHLEEQLVRATNPAHRAMLERALKALES